MASTIEFEAAARKELAALDKEVAKRIVKFLAERLAPMDNPRALGAALRGGELGDFWKYRVGDWRLICKIDDLLVTVLVLRIGHRRDVYR